MRKIIEDYLSGKKEEQVKQMAAFLVSEGLYEKQYGDYAFSEPDTDEDEQGVFKKVPIDLTEEEYNELKNRVQIQSEASSNVIAGVLTVIAILEMIAGLIVGIAIGTDWGGWGPFFEWFGIGLVTGFFTLGFAEVIKLLQRIANKK